MSPRSREVASLILIAPGLLGLAVAALILAGEGAFWFKHGASPGWTMMSEFGWYPASEYLGLNKMVRWYLDLRMSVAIALASIVSLVVAYWISFNLDE